MYTYIYIYIYISLSLYIYIYIYTPWSARLGWRRAGGANQRTAGQAAAACACRLVRRSTCSTHGAPAIVSVVCSAINASCSTGCT